MKLKLLEAIKEPDVVMLVLTEKLIAPLGQVAPPSYAGERKGDPPRYVEWKSDDGRLNALLDSIQSQANRIEPIFANYPDLVPDIKVVYPDKAVSLVNVPHRAADATLKYHFRDELTALHKGDMVPLGKRNGTALLFGLYDSRGTGERLDRMITAAVVARGVARVPKAATKTELLAPEDREKLGFTKDKLSEYGIGEVPNYHESGVLDAQNAEIERRVVFDLSLLSRLNDSKLREYVKGLGLVALLHPVNMRLRSGTSLAVANRSLGAYKHCAEMIEVELDDALDDALGFARRAAQAFGIAKPETIEIDVKQIAKGLREWRGENEEAEKPQKARAKGAA
jgi:CRISPR-associated protein Csb1